MRLLRLLATGLGAVVLLVAIGGIALLLGRVVYVSVWDPGPSAEGAAAKAAYLADLPQVDPAVVPSFVVIYFDDLGYGDLGVYGSRSIRTPRIDRAAAEGTRFTAFYAASPVCTPARAALLTGRYAPRAGITKHVFFPEESAGGWVRRVAGWGNALPADEIVVAEVLAAAGYATGMVGKWHLGGRPGHRPRDFGFASYYGLLWSNDMWPLHLWRDDAIEQRDERRGGFWRGERDEERPLGAGGVDQSTLTAAYTREAVAFLEANRERPFFLYLSHTAPHVPHYPDRAFAGSSRAGPYGDVVEDLDRSTGAVLDALDRLGIAERTLVLITSDNGPDYAGSPGGLRGRKGEVLEGGQRVPLVALWPGRVPAGRTSDGMGMQIDVLPTVLELAGLPLPRDREIDGRSLAPLLVGDSDASPHEWLFYFPAFGDGLPEAVRDARFKYLRETGDWGRSRGHLTGLDLDEENHGLALKHPQAAERLAEALAAMRDSLRDNPRGWRTGGGG
jgi:arylsulfatase A-like enzyme